MYKMSVRIMLVLALAVILSGCQNESYQKIVSDDDMFVVVNLMESSLSYFDNHTREEVAKWELPFTFTGALLLPGHERILLYGKHLENIYVYNITTGKRVDRWNSGQGIVNAVLSKDEKMIFLADQENDVVRVLSLTGETIGEIAVGEDPLTILQSEEEDLLYVFNFRDPMIHVVNLETMDVIQAFNGKVSTVGAVLLEEFNELWTGGHGANGVAGNTISIYSLTEGTMIDEIKAPIMPVDLERKDKYIYAVSHGSNQLRKISVETKQVLNTIEIGANPFEILINGDLLYIASYDSDEIIIVDPVEMKVIDNVKTGRGPFQLLFKRGVIHE